MKLDAISFYTFRRVNWMIFNWLRHYATSRKVASSRPGEVNELFSLRLILPEALGPGVYSASNRNEYQKRETNNSGGQSAADNLTAICQTMWDP
jgi:hypothetical protein